MKSRSLKNRKAWLRIVEVVLAATLIFVYLIHLQQISTVESAQSPDWDKVRLKLYGEDILRALDNVDTDNNYRGDLRDTINESDWNSINANITQLLPKNVGYTLYLYTASDSFDYQGGTQPKDIPIKKDTVSVYYIAAQTYGHYCDFDDKTACALKIVLWFKQ